MEASYLPLGDRGIWAWAALAFHEVALGLFLGFVVQFLIWAVQFAGQMVGFQMGFGIVSVIDPESGQQLSLIARYKALVALILFIVLDGHHLLLEALVYSFEILPAGSVLLSRLLFDEILRLSARIFVLGLMIGAPMMAALLLSEMGMGIVARTVPQMNIFIVGFPLKISVGLAMLALVLPYLVVFFDSRLQELARGLSDLLGRLM